MPEKKYEVLMDADGWDHKAFRNKHDYIKQWFRRKDSTGTSRRTLNSYSRTVAKIFHDQFPETHPSDVTVGDVEEYVLDLNDRDVAQNTKRRYIESLSAFYSWAMKRPRFEDITGNPAAVLMEEIPKKKLPRPDTATWENGKKIIQEVPDPRDKTAVVLIAKTGARVKEVLTVKEEDLMLEDGVIRFGTGKAAGS